MTDRPALERAVVEAMDKAATSLMRWGVDDCALWCANALRDELGFDPAAHWRGHYRTRRGAMRAAGKGGLLGALRKAARSHDWQRIDPALAQPGDIGMAWTVHEGQPVLSTVMCRSKNWFVGRSEFGFAVVPSAKVVIAWSVLPDALAPSAARANLKRISLRPDLCPTPAAHHEPVSTFIGLTALIEGLGVSAAAAGAIGGAIVYVGASVAVSLAASLLSPHTGSTLSDNSIASTSAQQQQQLTERQPIPFKRVIVGRAYVGGALFFEQVKPPFLYMGVLLNWGQIAGIESVYIGANKLTFPSGISETIITPVNIAGQPDYANHFRCSVRYGSFNQLVDPLILSGFPSIGGSFRQRGIATIIYRYSFGADQTEFTALWGQVQRPVGYVVAKGVAAYDPRDPSQSLSDETTWRWTNNAALIQAWYLTRDFGGRIPKSNIRWDKIAESADYDDSLIGCNDGTKIARHTIDGVLTMNEAPFSVMQQLLTANRGMILQSGGKVWVQSSMPKTPVATIHDRILTGGLTYQADKQKSDKVNKLQVRFVAPDQDYQTVDGPILTNEILQVEVDKEVLPATLALNYTQDHRRAQRLQKAFFANARLGRTISCNVDLQLMAIAAEELVGSVVTVDSQLFSNTNGNYLITAVGMADDLTTLSLAMTEYDASIETNWNPELDEKPFTLANLNTA